MADVKAAPKANKMGYMPMGKLLATMSIPIIISLIISALYNIIDSIYVSQIGENALTAVTLCFPMQMIMMAIGAGMCVGVNALLSKALGERNHKLADLIAQHALFLAAISSVVVGVIFYNIAPGFIASQAKNADPIVVTYGTAYLKVVSMFYFGSLFGVTLERLLTSTGRTNLTMYGHVTGAVLNIILDPIFIFGKGPIPAFGVAGAAYATIIGQIVSAIISLVLNIRKNHEINLFSRGFRPSMTIIKNIYRIGVPSMIMQCIGSFTTLGINGILMSFTPTAIATNGVFNRINSMIMFPVFGISSSMVPIIAFNYGAQNKKRVNEAVNKSTLAAFVIMAIGVFVLWVFPRQLMGIFNATPEMEAIGVWCFRLISTSFIPASYCMLRGSAMQALGNSFYTMLTSLLRQIIVLLPAAFLFSRLFGLNGTWLGWPCAEVASLILNIFFYRSVYKKTVGLLPDEQPLEFQYTEDGKPVVAASTEE